jgi:hypothetical protein
MGEKSIVETQLQILTREESAMKIALDTARGAKEIADQKKAKPVERTVEIDDDLLAVGDMLGDASEYKLESEVVCYAMKALADAITKGDPMSIREACTHGLAEWLK